MMGRTPILALVGAGTIVTALWVYARRTTVAVPQPQPKTQTQVSVPPPVVPIFNTEPVCENRKHTVEKGETLWGIANDSYGNRGYLYQLIAETNNLDPKEFIHPGQSLVIPCCLCNLSALAKAVAKVKKTVVRKRVARAPQPVRIPEAPKPEEHVTVTTAPLPQAEPAQVQPATSPQTQSQSQTVVVNVPTPPPVETPQATPVTPPTIVPERKPLPEPVRPLGPSPKSSILTPWSVWNTFLTTPLEKGNKLDYFHVDLGAVIGRIGKIQIEPYLAMNGTKDTKGYQWNNRVKGEGGLKLVLPVKAGLMAIGGAYASEWRAASGNLPSVTKSAPIGFYEHWFGWNQLNARSSNRHFMTGLPGQTWLQVGNISPYEKGNVIGLTRLEQGVTALRFKHLALVPQGTFQIGADTKHYSWNNRYAYGGNLKVAFPTSKAAFDIQGGYECAEQYRGPVIAGLAGSGRAACGPIVRVNLWTGGRRIGGE